jgi:hypothetical protein
MYRSSEGGRGEARAAGSGGLKSQRTTTSTHYQLPNDTVADPALGQLDEAHCVENGAVSATDGQLLIVVTLVGATGFEPEPDSASSNCTSCSCVDCEMCRAANALHFGRFQWLETALNDADLQRVIASWATMPAATKRAVIAVAESS